MTDLVCDDLKASMLAYLQEQIEVTRTRDLCIVTMPIRALGDTWIDVFVEQRLKDHFLVHDAGKTVNSLFSQGVDLTPTRASLLSRAAQGFGVKFQDQMFTVGCKAAQVQQSVLAISQCVSIAMVELLGHKLDFEEEPIISWVGQAVHEWGADNRAHIKEKVVVPGQTKQHRFDFVASLPAGGPTIAINVLPPSEPQARAERYGFLVLDLERNQELSSWRKLVVLAKSEHWSTNAKRLIAMHAQDVVGISKLDTQANRAIRNSLDLLKVAA